MTTRVQAAHRAWLVADGVEPAPAHRGDGMGVSAMHRAGLPAPGRPEAVAPAQPAVRAAARTLTTVPGGHGAVREIASWILEEDQL